MLGAMQWRGGRGDVWGGVASTTAFAWKVCYDVAMFMCATFLFDSRPADDPPEPQRLEPVGVEGREVDDRVGPDRDADERPAPPLVIGARRVRLLVLERLLDGGLGERVPRRWRRYRTRPELVGARRSRFTKRLYVGHQVQSNPEARDLILGDLSALYIIKAA